MSKFFRILILYCLFFCNIASACDGIAKVSVQRIKQEKKRYQKEEEVAKKFKRAVAIFGTIGATGLLGLIGYNIYRYYNCKSDEEKKEAGSNSYCRGYNCKSDKEKKEAGSNSYCRERDEKFLNLCKQRFYDGITDGVYWAMSSVLITSGVGITSGLCALGKDRFMRAYRGNNKESFGEIKRQLDFELELFKSFFIPGFYDKQEIKDNHNYFVQIIESFLALVQVLFENREGLGGAEQQLILNGQDLLIARVNKFAQNLETNLNSVVGDEVDQGLLENIYISFNRLHNHTVRFINICCSILYEKG